MDGFDNVDGKTKCLCVSMTSLVFLVVGVLAFSFSSVEPTEYGLLYNRVAKSIDTEHVQEGGLQFVGPLNTIIKFPRTHQVIEFSDYKEANQPPLATRTAEGLELHLHVSFQY